MSSTDGNATSTEITSQLAHPPPVRYLRVLSQYGVILCAEHRYCHTISKLHNHLLRKHAVKIHLWHRIAAWIREQNIADSVTHPADYSPLIRGLAYENGFVCNVVGCNERTTSRELIERHCSKEHGVDSRRKQREQQMHTSVILQSLFAQSSAYFIVTTDPPPTTSSTPRLIPPPSTSGSTSQQHEAASQGSDILSSLSERLNIAVAEDKARFRQIGEPNHVSEVTPWLRKSHMAEHLAQIDGELIAQSHQVPQKPREDLRLYLIASSLDRVMRQAHDLADHLHHVDAQVLNTFQVGTMSADPFQQLQNRQSLNNYIHLVQSLFCYFIRASEGHLGREMFLVTREQQQALEASCAIVEEMAGQFTHMDFIRRRRQYREQCYTQAQARWGVTDHTPGHDDNVEADDEEQGDDGDEAEQGGAGGEHDDARDVARAVASLEKQLDRHVFRLGVALVQHKATKVYDSAIISFCAVAGSIVNQHDHTITYTSENQMAGVLSKLTYICQLLVLQKAHLLVEEDHVFDEMGDALKQLCDQWIVNNSRGPVGTMANWRLYTMRTASSTVPPALTVWDEDGRTLTYGAVRYGWQDLCDEMSFCLREAQDIFQNELCFGFSDIPTYPLQDLRDNWSAWRAGFSFLDDPRNHGYWEGHDTWLIERIARSASWIQTIFHVEHYDTESTASWPFRSEFARQYQISVEKFLEHMLVLVHKGSGQPARRVEFLGTRWRNVGTAPRNLLLHSGYLIFILSYHKSQARTHASRYPVRVIYPLVAQLLVQFFKLVQPLRLLMSRDVSIPSQIGDYIWSDGDKPWPETRMTTILQSMSRRSLGTQVSTASWRQIAVGFAVKKFSGMQYEADVDVPGNPDDDNDGEAVVADGVTLPAVFHAQTTHGPMTGNRAYGTTVNYSSGLTDAGLQTYLWASKLWWSLFEHALEAVPVHKRGRPTSMSEATPTLVKRVAHRVRAPRHLRQWGAQSVLAALQRLYQDPQARFRSDVQRQMVEMVAARHAEVVIVIPTGGGKSLAFLVPILLPQAGTTVVVVPLVALKQDMIRRCWDADIEYSIWDAHGHSERFVGTPLLFVSAEQAVREPFRRFLGRLDAQRQLDRVVFDECHLILTASTYRPKMALLRYLRDFRCQVVFLSATLPPSMMDQFQQRMLLDQPCLVRAVTFRSDLHYDFHRQSRAEDFEDYMVRRLKKIMEQFASDEQARVIVYVQEREEAQRMAERMQCEYYFSDSGTPEEKEQVMARWRRGIHRIIYATSAFGTGVDYAHVRMVVHQGLPRDAINFGQEIGRVGRDGQGGTSHIILPRTWNPINDATWQQTQSSTPLSERVMQRYVSQSRCLWATLSRYLDGIDRMQYCRATERLCGICREQGAFEPNHEADHTPYWDMCPPVKHRQYRDTDASSELVEDDDGSEEGDLDTEAEITQQLHGGSQRLRQSVRVSEEQRSRYLERCRRWQGVCLICQLLFGGQGVEHGLSTCRRKEKWQFFRAKGEVQKKQRSGWIRSHVACWSCGQLATICDGLEGPHGCPFRDMVLPGTWAMFHMSQLWGQKLGEVSGQLGGFSDEGAWMAWIGQECEVFGERGIQGVRMFAWLLEQMEQGEVGEAD